jgi:emp24/gp25L/p24 family/GOLD
MYVRLPNPITTAEASVAEDADTLCCPDQGLSRQRLRTTEGHHRRDQDGVHESSGHRVRRLLREHPRQLKLYVHPIPFLQARLPSLQETLISTTHIYNFLDSRSTPSRHVELDIDIGADAKDWSGIAAAEKLKPVEADLRRIEETVNEIVGEMEYLRGREQKLRDTNESTNERVKWFAFGTMGMLVGLGAWQIVYLRAYFR